MISPSSQRAVSGRSRGWPTLFGGLCAGLFLGGGLMWWQGGDGAPAPEGVAVEVGAVAGVQAPEVTEVETGPREIDLSLDRIDRLLPLEGGGICATARGALVCSGDRGESWASFGSLDEPILAVAAPSGLEFPGGAGPGLVAAAADGGLYRMAPGASPTLHTRPDAALHVVDASTRAGRLILLAHRYDTPEDELRLPRVVETLLLEATWGGGLKELGRWRGFGGERLLLEEGSIVTFALSDRRAWRSNDGGASSRRLPVHERFGADFGGLRAVVERGAERLPGPGRPARAISRLWIARSGGDWENALEVEGAMLVDFADASLGLVVATDEATAWLTTDGGRTFQPWLTDERLAGAVAASHVAGRFVVALGGGRVLLLDPEAAP